jgi:hypothetical protein
VAADGWAEGSTVEEAKEREREDGRGHDAREGRAAAQRVKRCQDQHEQGIEAAGAEAGEPAAGAEAGEPAAAREPTEAGEPAAAGVPCEEPSAADEAGSENQKRPVG